MSQRDRRWLYDGTTPEPSVESARAWSELQKHERKTLDASKTTGLP